MSAPGMSGFGSGYRSAKARMPDLLYQGGGQTPSGSSHEECRKSIDAWKEYAGNLEERLDTKTDIEYAYRETIRDIARRDHVQMTEEQIMNIAREKKDRNQEMRRNGNPIEEEVDF